MPGRILIVDDHEIIRKALRSLLSSHPEWTICGEATDGLEAVEKARTLRPDLTLMDVSMPRMDGLEATRIILTDLPGAKVIIVSQNDPDVVRRQAQEVSASAYVSKKDLSRNLLSMVSKVLGPGDAGTAAPPKPSMPKLAAPDWLAGGGTLGRLIGEHDWSKTPLGPIENWPQSLKTSVNLILNARHPMWIGWGRDGAFLYNDAYIQVLSMAKHPWVLGKPTAEVWPEIWDVIGHLVDNVYEKGEASFLNDVRFLMNRGDFVEELYFSFSYSPIRDESGAVAGLFCPTTDVTPKVINARRLGTLSELSAHGLLQKTTETACESAAAILSKNPDDIPFAILYLLDGTTKQARLEQTCVLSPGLDVLTPLSVDLKCESVRECFWPLGEVVAAGQSRVVSVRNVEGLPLGVAQQRLREALILPVTSRGEGGTLGILVVGVNPARKLDAEYRTFYELVAGQIATAIQNARAAEEERKRLEALAEIDRAKTAFFSNVSHEFRTPLTLMLGPVDDLLAKSHTDLSPAAKSQLELVSRNGTRLLRLVNTLLDFSRLEAGRMQAIYQATDLAAFTIELASVFRSATEKAGLRLELDCPQLAELVYVDRGMWEKIVLNLISNAFKFTLEGGISISLSATNNAVELRVRDTGVGIPAAELPHLFDRFHRIENTRSRTHEGSGIGLALVNELVKLHGGSVRVESSLGEGSTFIVGVPLGKEHLPADRIGGVRTLASTALGAAPFVEEALRWIPDREDHEAAEEILPADELIPVPTPAVAEGESASAQRPHILVADDNADMRQYLVRLLAERYDVKAVPDGQAALSSVWERAPELVLSDVMMPILDGFSLLHAMRADPKTRTIPVILLSARAGEEARVEGIDHGADDYLIKPFSARELLARVQTHLEIARVRSRAELALRRRTEQFEVLLNEAPMGVYLVDGDFRIRALNPLAMTAFDSIPDLIGRDFGEVLHILRPATFADEIVERFRHTLETGEPYSVPEQFGERLDRGHPEIYEWQISRIPLPEGGYGVVCYFRDISHRVQAREAIAESEKRLRLATEATELGIASWYINEDRVTWENDRACQIFGRSRQDGDISVAEFTAKICHPDDLPAFQQTLSHTLETGARLFFQCRIYRNDGACAWVEISAQAERRVDGSPLRLLGTVRDITERKQAEEAIRQSEERLRLAQKAGRSGTWEFNFKNRTLITSPELKELYGLSPGTTHADADQLRAMIYPGDLANLDKLLAHAIDTHGEYHIEFRIARADGAERWIESNAQIFYDDGGQAGRIIGISTDITERKHIQGALVDNKERLRLALNAARMSTWDCDLVEDKIVWSENPDPQSGMPPGAFSGHYSDLLQLVHPDDRHRVSQAVARSLYHGADYHLEFRVLRADGSIRWTESRGSVFRDENAKPVRMMGIEIDITQRKQMEERERQMAAEAVAATAKFRAVFEQTPVFAGIMALDGTTMDANELCLQASGYRAEDVLGRPFWETGWWRSNKQAQAKIRAATEQAAQGAPYRETLAYHWADGTERLVDFALHPIRDQQGRILFLHPTGVDITDLKRTEEKYRTLAETLDAEVRARTREVVQQSEQLRDLSSRLLQAQDEERRHIARELHDSAGQLLTVLGINLAQAARHAPQEATEFAKWIQESEELVQQLSQEIRTMSYLLHPPLLEERGLLETIRWYIDGLAQRSGLDIALEAPANFRRLSPDMELVMFRLVQECLTNIHRHSGSATAAICLSRRGKIVALEVRDEGKGLSAEKLSEIQSQGSGVGIRGMRERVRHFGGHMQIESNAAGTKISFEFTVPGISTFKRADTTPKPANAKNAPVAR